jgi:ribosomal protein L7/L12
MGEWKMNEMHQMDRIEAKLDQIINRDQVLAKAVDIKSFKRCLDFVRDKHKIEAIKECRAMLGIGLKEAKDLIEEYL